jgi:prepilin-type N-terminal cleavage/methylation domain-containing protein
MKGQRGMTLVELVVVLSIAAVLCCVAVPGIVSARRTFGAAGAAGHLALVLREAQARAEASGVPVRVVVAPSGNYRVLEAGDGPDLLAGGYLGAGIDTNYPDGTVEFGTNGFPTVAGGSSPRAGHFTVVGAATARSVVVQLGGCVRCV